MTEYSNERRPGFESSVFQFMLLRQVSCPLWVWTQNLFGSAYEICLPQVFSEHPCPQSKLFVNSHGQLPSIFRENECSPLPCAVEFNFFKKHKICFSLLIEIHWILEHRTDKHGTVHLMRECRKPNQKWPDTHGEVLYIESGEADGGWRS